MTETKKYKKGYIPGTFDMFHIGHLNLIRRAKEQCEYLIIGLCTDEYIKSYKGKPPVIPYEERKEILLACKYVDEVVPCDIEFADKIKAWEALHYDAHFCGDDHVKHWMEERAFLKEKGADFVFFPYTKERSSTMIRNAIGKGDITYVPTETDRAVWARELEILKIFEKICVEHGLKYYALYGTLLGAVRHQGFIPWDDDLDVGMKRDDLNKFLALCETELPDNIALCDWHTEKSFSRHGIIRLRDKTTTAMEGYEYDYPVNKGVWIDIIPLDASPKDDALFREKAKKVSKAQIVLDMKTFGGLRNEDDYEISKAEYKKLRRKAFFTSREKCVERVEKAMSASTGRDEEIGIFTGWNRFRQLHSEDFEDTCELSFMDTTIMAPADYKDFLFTVYGENYMKIPVSSEQRPKHMGIYDLDRPYTYYEKILYGTFEGCEGKKIILFGAGMMFDDYMKKWGNKHRPEYVADNDSYKWGRARKGIEIISPADILKIPENKRHIIITSVYYKEIEKQLSNMGINDTHIYVQNIGWIIEAEREKKGEK